MIGLDLSLSTIHIGRQASSCAVPRGLPLVFFCLFSLALLSGCATMAAAPRVVNRPDLPTTRRVDVYYGTDRRVDGLTFSDERAVSPIIAYGICHVIVQPDPHPIYSMVSRFLRF